MKPILAGPFLGEFGWELFCWQGRLRYMALQSGRRVYVMVAPEKAHLYEDFGIIGSIPERTSVCNGSFDPGIEVISGNQLLVNYEKDWTDAKCQENGFKDQRFVMYGSPLPARIDVVIHARSRRNRSHHNWAKSNYILIAETLAASGLSVAQIGLRSETYFLEPEFIRNYRDASIRATCDVLRSARLVVGTSSGPMHLAALCGCPQLVLTDETNRARYERHWNPFSTLATITGTWLPSAKDVLRQVLELLNRA